jgi:uncharacterized metal-binding protein YceD (DUF177 family)
LGFPGFWPKFAVYFSNREAVLKDYRVHIAGLSEKVHSLSFDIGEDFFERYGRELVPSGRLMAAVELDKRETLMIARFRIRGSLRLVCDRTLEAYDYPVEIDRNVHFKFGEVYQEINDEIIVVRKDADTLDLGQFMYEFIALAVPMKKLHPRLAGAEGDTEGVVYSTTADSAEGTDPRWEILRKIK